jgi:two-component system NtrC family sensor kinase
MQDYYKSMKRMIFSSTALVFFIPFVLTIGIGYYYFATSLKTNTLFTMNRIVQDHRHMIESFLKERQADLEFTVASYRFEDISQTERLREVFYGLRRGASAFVDLGILNESGVQVAYHGPFGLKDKIYTETDWFKEVMKKGHYISDIFLGYRRVPHFIVAVAGSNRGRKWAARATIDSNVFSHLVKAVRIGKTGEAYILNPEGMFQTESRSGGNLMDKDPDYKRYSTPHKGIRTFITEAAGGGEYLYATTWLKEGSWLLVVRQEKADAFYALRWTAYLIGVVAVIGAGMMLAATLYVSDHIVKRMKQMDSEKELLGKQLVRATRLAEIGEMATGFAHEINNPLQIMKSELSLIHIVLAERKEKGDMKESEWSSELEDSLGQIDLQIGRASKITHAILKFGRQGEAEPQDVDIRSMIPEITEMIAKKANVEGITIRQEIASNTPPTRVDPGQLQQVLVNLFNNAMYAIVEKHGSQGGELLIEAGPKGKGHVNISVSDNGWGISPENLTKVFSPFFTTKPVGKGTGLGLSVCHGIIENMGGTMDVSSEEGHGTTFVITLPAAT